MSWEDRITLFVGYLIQEGKQSSMVKSYVSAIKTVLRDDGLKILEDKYLISSLTKACRLINDQFRTRLPIQKGMLVVLLEKVEEIYHQQPYLSLMYHTLFSTAYLGLFRVSELTEGQHPVLAKDVHIASNKRKLLFILRSSKTHGRWAKPQLIKISSTSAAPGKSLQTQT